MELSAQEQLEKAMLDAYHLNILYLSEFDKELLIRINNLSEMIASGEYKERFFIEFLEDKGDFDVYDSKYDKFLYAKEPKKFNNKAVVQTNFDLKNSINTLNTSVYNHFNNGKFNTENKEDVFDSATKKILNDFFPIKEELKFEVNREHRKINSIDKFMFIGTMIGRHIPKIMKKVNAKTYFICENNLELFRLSLFVCDYSAVVVNRGRIFFSIMDDDDVFMDKFLSFYHENIYSNALLKFYSTNYNVNRFFDRILDKVLTNNPFLFNYEILLNSVVRNLSNNFFEYKTLSLKKQVKLKSLDNKPLLYIGAGPSLSENLDWIKKNKDKFVIVTMAATLKTLAAGDIKPDIITSLDPQHYVYEQFFTDPKVKEIIKDTIIITSINTFDKALKELNNVSNVYLYEVLGSLQNNIEGFSGYSIGEITFSIISSFVNVKEIYLVGLDLALNQDTGSTHDSSYAYNKSMDIKNIDNESIKENYQIRTDVIEVPGNIRKKVLTSRLFYASLIYMSAISKSSPVKTYNLSSHGAYIEDTKPLDINDIELNFEDINKEDLKEELKKDLDEVVCTKFDKLSLQNLNKHIRLVNELLNLIENYPKIKKYEDLHTLVNKIFEEVSIEKSNIKFLKTIYATYSLSFIPYIYYCTQIKDKKDKINMKKISEYWKEKLSEILLTYKAHLENIREESLK